MNITEFAIGNYVLLNGRPERVKGVLQDQFEKGRDVLLLGEKAALWYTLKEIQPIPACKQFIEAVVKDQSGDFSALTQLFAGDIYIGYLHQFCNLFQVFSGYPLEIDYDKLKEAI